MKALLKYISIILLLVGCNLLEVPVDMFTLDQSFIAVWLPIQQDELEEATEPLLQFQNQWTLFRTKYEDLLKTENQIETARLLDQWIADADICLKQRDALCIKVKLDQFKFELQNIRSYWESDYYLDYLWDFEENIYQFLDIAIDPKLDLLEWNEFMPYLLAINNSFDKLEQMDLDPEFFDFDKVRIETYDNLKIEVANRLECLNGLTEGAQIEEISECARGIQQVVYQMIALFGKVEFQTKVFY